MLEQAIALDRHYGPALAWVAFCQMTLIRDGWVEAPETNRRKGVDLARRALEVAENDPGILANAAFVLAYFGEDIGAMLGLVDRALALNPSFARGWYFSGMLRIMAGEHDLAIEHLETSLRLSPRERMGQPLSVMGLAYFFKRRLTRRRRSCCWPFKTILAFPPHTAHSPRVMPIWAGSTKRARSSPGCAPSPLWSCRASPNSATPRTVSCSSPACAWRSARRADITPA
ncbi:MAG TPA: tetratricopeptide repeat protein [Stellaceae bacterium]